MMAPELHTPISAGNFSMDFFEEVQVNASFAFLFAEGTTLAAPKIPGFIATYIEIGTAETRKQFVVEFAQKWQCVRMIGRKRGWITQKGSVRAFVRLADF